MQEVGEIRNMLQQINNSEHAPNKSGIAELTEGEEDYLTVDNGDRSYEENEVSRDALKIKHEEDIGSFFTLRILRQRYKS